MTEGPTNLELAEEASKTSNHQRQCELAEVPSEVVLKALHDNPHLCDAARAILDHTVALQQETAKSTAKTLGDI